MCTKYPSTSRSCSKKKKKKKTNLIATVLKIPIHPSPVPVQTIRLFGWPPVRSQHIRPRKCFEKILRCRRGKMQNKWLIIAQTLSTHFKLEIKSVFEVSRVIQASSSQSWHYCFAAVVRGFCLWLSSRIWFAWPHVLPSFLTYWPCELLIHTEKLEMDDNSGLTLLHFRVE